MPAAVHILLGGIGDPILGFPGGWDGPVTSEGLIYLGNQLATIPGVSVTMRDWGDYVQLAPLIADEHDRGIKTAVIGYSGGGSRATWLANTPSNKIWLPIDLIVGYDPSPSWQMTPLHANVGKAICYYNETPLMLGLGGGKFTAAPQWGCKTILTRQVSEQHLLVQGNQELHVATIQSVKDLLAS